jgi:hypothetical protein
MIKIINFMVLTLVSSFILMCLVDPDKLLLIIKELQYKKFLISVLGIIYVTYVYYLIRWVLVKLMLDQND